MQHHIWIQSPFGLLLATGNGYALTGLYFGPDYPPLKSSEESSTDVMLQATSRWLQDYFRGECLSFPDIPMCPKGTQFQHLVWEKVKTIPYGETVSYGQIAKAIAEKMGVDRMSAQAIGGALGRNPIPIIVPCHRVLGAGRSLTGFTGGIEKKRFLLDLEQIPYKK